GSVAKGREDIAGPQASGCGWGSGGGSGDANAGGGLVAAVIGHNAEQDATGVRRRGQAVGVGFSKVGRSRHLRQTDYRIDRSLHDQGETVVVDLVGIVSRAVIVAVQAGEEEQ